MAEETGQSEKVKQNQLAIARSMQVQPPAIKALEEAKEWQAREWLYICALDGMKAETIGRLAKAGATAMEIQKARMGFLRDKYGQTDTLQKDIDRLKAEVEKTCRESRAVRNEIETGLEEALKKQAQAQEETIRAKDQMIELLQARLSEIRGQGRGKQESSPPSPIPQDAPAPLGPGGREGTAAGSRARMVQEEVKKSQGRKGLLRAWEDIRRESDAKKFIERYMQDARMGAEQREFLLDCLEEGMSFKEIEKFASPCLSVAVMKRLKRLQYK